MAMESLVSDIPPGDRKINNLFLQCIPKKCPQKRSEVAYHKNCVTMQVSYYVDGESGFVPTITFSENYSPDWAAGTQKF
jgi:hypothetical protein